jgi:hypothetical protein
MEDVSALWLWFAEEEHSVYIIESGRKLREEHGR